MKDQSLVGIALALYEPAIHSLSAQLRSIVEQSYKNWVCVITADSPLEKLKGEPTLAEFFKDPRFRWSENPTRLGFKNNFQRAIEICVDLGVRYIACSDQDDFWYPEKVSECVKVLETKPPLSLVHCDMDVFIGEKNLGSAWALEHRNVNTAPESFFLRNVVTGASLVMDAQLAKKYPQIPSCLKFHDQWFALVAALNGGVYPIFQKLYRYNQHGTNVIGVAPFYGVFHAEKKGDWLKLTSSSRRTWKNTQELFYLCRRLGISVKPKWSFIFSQRFGLGFGLALYGMRAWLKKDQALARAAFINAVGKFLNAFH